MAHGAGRSSGWRAERVCQFKASMICLGLGLFSKCFEPRSDFNGYVSVQRLQRQLGKSDVSVQMKARM